jgi:hypothetical protein
MPLTVAVPINGGSGTVQNAGLTLVDSHGTKHVYPLTSSAGGYKTTIDCVQAGQLYVDFDLKEGAQSQHFTVPIGGLSLIDPSGDALDSASGAPLSGVSVRLYRKNASGYDNVLSGDPGISPHVNPEITGADGKWGWDVSAGTYRVVASKAGYDTLTSPDLVVTDGHPVTGVHLRLHATSSGTPTSGGTPPPVGGSPPPSGGTPPPVTVHQPGPCAGKKGKALASCKKLQKALAGCKKLKGAKRALCVKRAKALAKCDRITKKGKHAACVKKAKQIGKKKKSAHH